MVNKTDELSQKVLSLHNNAKSFLLNFADVRNKFGQKREAKHERKEVIDEEKNYLNELLEKKEQKLTKQ